MLLMMMLAEMSVKVMVVVVEKRKFNVNGRRSERDVRDNTNLRMR